MMKKNDDFYFSISGSETKVAEYLEAIAKGFRSGTISFESEESTLTLKPEADIALDLRARVRGVRNKISIECRWWVQPDSPTDLDIQFANSESDTESPADESE